MKITCHFVLIIVLGTLCLSACTDVRRFVEEKAATKSKSAASKDSSIFTAPELKFPSISASPSPSAKSTPVIATFQGDLVGKAGRGKFYQFLSKHEQGTVRIDLLLSDEQLKQMTETDSKKWYLDLSYPDKDGFNAGGELWIDVAKGKSGLQINGNHVQGNIRIIEWDGPHQGLMSINAKPAPVNAELKATPGAVTKPEPVPSAKAQPATRPRTVS